MHVLSVTLLLTIMITPVSTTHADGTQPSSYSLGLPDLGDPLYLAQADSQPAKEAAQSEQCLAFSKDLNADLGEVLRAGCEPTLAQMSKLMDNPLNIGL